MIYSDVLFHTVNWWFTVLKRSNLTLWRDFTLFSQCVHTVFHTVFFPAGKCPPPIGIRVKPSNLNNMVCSFWWSSRATQIDLSLHTCIFIWHCVLDHQKVKIQGFRFPNNASSTRITLCSLCPQFNRFWRTHECSQQSRLSVSWLSV